MLIDITMMRGEIPRFMPHLLPNEAATMAQDCQFERGVVEPLKSDLMLSSLPQRPKTLFKYNDTWLQWSNRVNAINSPMAQDEWGRVYWSGQGKPKVSSKDILTGSSGVNPQAWYDLGVPAPSAPPVVTNIDESTGEDPPEGEHESYDDEDRVYIQTFVTRFGEEGKPGEPSEVTLIKKPGSTVTVQLSQITVNTHNITHTRLYRSVTSSGNAEYVMVAELPISQQAYKDSEKDANGSILETWDYDLPDENMQGLCVMANGICAGFAGNEVRFSEAYLPYAWPKSYSLTSAFDIVACVAIGNALVVGTKGNPYLFTGVTPSAITATKLNSEQACVSAESMVAINGAAIYASPDGLVAVTQDGASLVTEQLIDRKTWQSFKPESIRAWANEGQYIALYDGGGFVFDLTGGHFTRISNTWHSAYTDLEADRLVIAKDRTLYAWKSGPEPISYEWKSKTFVVPKHSVFSSMRIVAEEIDKVAVDVNIDGELVLSLSEGELDDELLRLSAVRGSKVSVRVGGRSRVERIMIASTMAELS
ncbi:hypothetical protein [Vibrio metschnikovii]|uniref:hypothetical protein n=1 Tax=Vibrio metschnikovii TaxID=28172 RepID=UPI002FCB34E7